MTFFLATHFRIAYNIDTTPVIGYVNDGESDATASHAWLELAGKKTDLTLAQTEHPDAQPSGAVLILDRVMQSGRAQYTYHKERSAAALRFLEHLSANPKAATLVRQKELEHRAMIALAKSPHEMRRFLDRAPDGLTYEIMARRLL